MALPSLGCSHCPAPLLPIFQLVCFPLDKKKGDSRERGFGPWGVLHSQGICRVQGGWDVGLSGDRWYLAVFLGHRGWGTWVPLMWLQGQEAM